MKRYFCIVVCIPGIFTFTGCKARYTPFTSIPADKSGIDFSNDLAESDSHNILSYLYYYNGAGVAIADFNKDGLEDILFTANENSCKIYLNEGEMKFKDITAPAGLNTDFWATGATVVDINADSWPDIYISAAGYDDPSTRRNRLYVHQGLDAQGLPTFVEQAEAFGIADTGYTTQSVFFDFDRDGLLDLYVMNHSNDRSSVNTPSGRQMDGKHPSQDRLYRNTGTGKFEDLSQVAGIVAEGYGLGISIGDFNDDNWPDIYIANDFIYNDLLYINQKDGTFKEEIQQYLAVQTYNSMGCDLADINNDGFQDLIVLDMLPPDQAQYRKMAGSMTFYKWGLMLGQGYAPQYMRNTLHMSTGNPSVYKSGFAFSETGRLAGVSATDWSWSALFADWDNDGWKDLYITNGYKRDITDKDFADYTNSLIMFSDQSAADTILLSEIKKRPGLEAVNTCFINEKNGLFKDISTELKLNGSFSNGAAYADLDNDGDLDLVVNNIGQAAFLLQNNQSEKDSNSYIQIELKGPKENPTGIGSKIEVLTDTGIQTFYQNPVRGFMSHVSEIIHAGLDSNQKIREIKISWPDGKESIESATTPGQRISFSHSKATAAQALIAEENPGLFTDITNQFPELFIHKNNSASDFYINKLIHKSYSSPGPVMTIADLNHDDLDDVFFSGNDAEAGLIAYQEKDGEFNIKHLNSKIQGNVSDAVILDYNCDGWNDLWIIRGGNSSGPAKAFLSQIFLNNQKGNFIPLDSALFYHNAASHCITASQKKSAEYSQFVFIGASISPGNYPDFPDQKLYQIDCGTIKDISHLIHLDNDPIGHVHSANWADIDADGNEDLLLAGHWMSPVIFYNRGGTFEKQNIQDNIPGSSLKGWWNSLHCADLDGDGLLDILLGNEGLNGRYPANADSTIRLYYDDFDENGQLDPLLAFSSGGKYFPIHSKDELKAQIPGIVNKFTRHQTFVNADIEQILNPGKSKQLKYVEANQMSSLWLRNMGSGKFEVQFFPLSMQIAPIQEFVDLKDSVEGISQILVLGNAGNAEITTGYQLGYNPEIIQFKAGVMNVIPAQRSGIYLKNIQKKGGLLRRQRGSSLLLIAAENGPVRIFGLAPEKHKKLL
jgi:hypothetical protein